MHWFQLAGSQPTLDIHSSYVKQSFRNRYDILGVNGKVTLTFPVQGQEGKKIPLKDIRLVADSWAHQHLGTIRSAYGRSAFFEYYIDDVISIYNSKPVFLIDLSLSILTWYNQIGIQLNWQTTKEVPQRNEIISDLFLEPSFQAPQFPYYPQVFSDRHGFINGLSSLDVIFNKGPKASEYLAQTTVS
jgi:hypothetical protein